MAQTHRPLAGVFWMLVAGLCFVGFTVTIRHLSEVPTAQSAFLRFAFGVILLLPLWRQITAIRPSAMAWRLLGLRTVVHTVAVLCWFYAMARMPIAEVTAMNYLNPVLVTLGAALLLGEPIAARRIAAAGVALIGALIILRPGFREVTSAHLAMLCTATGLAASYLIVRRVSAELEAAAVVMAVTLGVTITLAPLAALVWEPLTLTQTALLVLTAFLATAGHYAMTLALSRAPVAVTQPVTFLQLVWASLAGLFIFGEQIDPFVIAGGGLILAAVCFIALREAQLAANRPPPPPEQ